MDQIDLEGGGLRIATHQEPLEGIVLGYGGVEATVFKCLNIYLPKSTMGIVDPLKGPPSDSMTCSDNFILNHNSVNISGPKIISYIPLADSSTLHFHITTFAELSVGKVKYTLTLRLVVIFPACVCHYITIYFSGCSFSTSLYITIMELYPLSNRIWKLLNSDLPFLIFIHPCRIGE